MWRKNLTFLVAMLLAISAAAAGLWPQHRLEELAETGVRDTSTLDWQPVTEQLDRQFHEHWQSLRLQHAPPADDIAVARRIGLALTGSVPSIEEIRVFESIEPQRRLQWWINRLLADRRTADYLAERLARSFVGTDEGPFLVYRRRRFVRWLSDQLMANRPYDALVRELLATSGLWTNNPAVNFITATANENTVDPIRLAGRTSRALLGTRIDCLQCHDDKLGNVNLGEPGSLEPGTQQDFHQLAAFFSGVSLSLAGVRDNPKPYEYRYLDAAEEEAVPPAVPFCDASVPDAGTRREQLAAWVTAAENRPFARAIVNRMWAILFGRPLVEPIDDIPLEGPYPPGLEMLTDDFIEHGYDLKRLILTILGSNVFRCDSRADFEITGRHERHFAVFPLTRLRPEQAAGALLQACSLKTLDANTHIAFRLVKFGQQSDFVRRYGDMGEDEFVDRGGTIPQRLLMMNGDLLHSRTEHNPALNASAQIASFSSSDRQMIETAYLAVLTRRPSPEELQYFEQQIDPTDDASRSRVCEDLYWVLLNSSEFLWNH